jgi:hypothetical protein
MKTKNLLFIGLGAVAVYFLYKKFMKKDTFANFANYGSGDIAEEDPHNMIYEVTDINRRG